MACDGQLFPYSIVIPPFPVSSFLPPYHTPSMSNFLVSCVQISSTRCLVCLRLTITSCPLLNSRNWESTPTNWPRRSHHLDWKIWNIMEHCRAMIAFAIGWAWEFNFGSIERERERERELACAVQGQGEAGEHGGTKKIARRGWDPQSSTASRVKELFATGLPVLEATQRANSHCKGVTGGAESISAPPADAIGNRQRHYPRSSYTRRRSIAEGDASCRAL